MYNENYLRHYGVLGMHWGHNRGSSITTIIKTHKRSINPSEDHRMTVSLKKKKVKELTNAELKSLTNRMQLEKQYKDLNLNAVRKGTNVVKGVTAVGTTLASLYALTNTPLYKDITKAIKAAHSA